MVLDDTKGTSPMRRRLLNFAAIVASLAPAMAGAGEILNIGDPAPPLTVSGWVKGEKVERFEPGKTYVVDFWGTWCGPCQGTIPHLTELAHKYKEKGVRFIGVDVWERDINNSVSRYVAAMGAKMDYSVALDDVPKVGNPRDGAMAKGWIKAAEENGLPITFVIRDGKIAWIGHPSNLVDPLARIVAGDGDFADLARTRLAQKSVQRRAMAIQNRVYRPYQARDYKTTLAAIAELTADDPGLADQLAQIRFTASCNIGEVNEAVAAGEKLFEQFKDDAQSLNNIFFYAVDLDLKYEPDLRVAQVALKALRRATELTQGEDMAIVDSLAVALFRTGNPVKAALTEAKALKILEETSPDRSHPYYRTFEDQLARFRKAAVAKAILEKSKNH
jgi:thiol-disulfide isomerase/thioredoxin